VQTPDPCPAYFAVQTYLNQGPVLSALGSPLNFTLETNLELPLYGFGFPTTPLAAGTGDSFRKGIHDLEFALAGGMKVALVYGDRDYRCNWMGGEATANNAAWHGQRLFANAGYEPFVTNATYNGGVTKQFGPLSFTRVFEAGHSVNMYQPETVYRVFMRSMFGRDVATGEKQVGPAYQSKGPASSWGWKDVLPKSLPRTCMVEGSFQNVSPPL